MSFRFQNLSSIVYLSVPDSEPVAYMYNAHVINLSQLIELRSWGGMAQAIANNCHNINDGPFFATIEAN